MKPQETLASVKVDGQYIPLRAGKQLAEGIPVEFREAPASLRVFYEEL